MTETTQNVFERIVNQIPQIGRTHHTDRLLHLAEQNLPECRQSIKQLPMLSGEKAQSGIVISAGPSVRKRNALPRIVQSGYQGTIIAVDGSYIACLKAGLIPDYVLILDPHPTRRLRWFGDPDFENDMENDDYFTRQDLDVAFRKNSIEQNEQHIALVNEHGPLTKAVMSSTSPPNLVARVKEAGFEIFWWNPLVDDPHQPNSVTRRMHAINKLPCMNTGGTVGTAAWVFANSILKLARIAVVGMDFGYYSETPIEQTQGYYELIHHLGGDAKIEQCFADCVFPLTGEHFYIDPTYFWYRKNCLELMKKATSVTFNCTEGGTLFDDTLKCVTLETFLEDDSNLPQPANQERNAAHG